MGLSRSVKVQISKEQELVNKKFSLEQDWYILNYTLVEVGDVVLTTTSDIMSSGIKRVTKGNYSHALACWQPGSYIDSTGDGVHSHNFQRLLLEQPDFALVLRLKEEYKEAIPSFVKYLGSQIGNEYTKKGAALSVLKNIPSPSTRKQFCSKLVAAGLKAAGIPVADPDKCTPHDLTQFGLFDEVSGCIHKASRWELDFAMSVEGNIPFIQKRVTSEMLEMCRKAAKNKHLYTLNDVTAFIAENIKFDRKVTKAIKQSGYFELYKIDIKKCPWRYNSVDFELFCNRNGINYAAMAASEIELRQSSLAHFETERLTWTEMYNQNRKLEYTRRFKLFYERLIKVHTDSLKMLMSYV